MNKSEAEIVAVLWLVLICFLLLLIAFRLGPIVGHVLQDLT